MPLVLTQHRDTIFEIILNRPEKLNAINQEMLDQFDVAVATANRTTDIRTVLIRGAGKSFSAGIDPELLTNLATMYGPDWKTRTRAVTAGVQGVFNRLEQLELPTICLMQGFCLGMALELALACDIRIATNKTVLSLPETRLGLIPDVGGTTRLTRLVGPARAKELIFTGRRFRASLAERWGIVNDVVPPDELLAAGEKMAAEIAKAAPLAVNMAKHVINGLADLERGLMLEGWAQSRLFNSEDFEEAMKNFPPKTPKFKGK